LTLAGCVAVLAAGAFPAAFPSRAAGAAQTLSLMLAAVGLNASAGYAGEPSLGQGAFVGIGAYSVALARVRAGLDPVTSTMAAVAIAAVAGAVVARVVSRLKPAFVALVTWLAAWMFTFALSSFPRASGGASGIVLPAPALPLRALGLRITIGATAWYEIALALVVLALAATHVLGRRYGPASGVVRDDPAIARGIGLRTDRVRAGAMILSAAVGGLSGAVLVQSAGVADPTAYGPVLSIKLFIVVLLGGAGTVLGPVVGLATLALVSGVASAFAAAAGGASGRFEPVAAGIVLVAVVAAAGRGIVPAVARRIPRATRRDTTPETTVSPRPGAAISAEDLRVTFAGVRALDGATIRVEPGTCHAIIGPNGSGKTTLLRALAGALDGVTGAIAIDGHGVGAGVRERIRLGVTRTFQRAPSAAGATAEDHVVAGLEPVRVVGLGRALLRTPAARSDEASARAKARACLARVGIGDRATATMEALDATEQRLVQIARALATIPRALLLDEPAAGTGVGGERRIGDLVRSLRDDGLTIVLVEHNLRLVSSVADRVTVLDAGRVIAEGPPSAIARDAAVRAAYLGDRPARSRRRRPAAAPA
jgi:branched-chain amino acid transport system permease protein